MVYMRGTELIEHLAVTYDKRMDQGCATNQCYRHAQLFFFTYWAKDNLINNE